MTMMSPLACRGIARTSLKRLVRAGLAMLCLAAICPLASCVDQHPERAEGAASDSVRIVATSPAVADMCDKLGLDLVGIPQTARTIPDRYRDAEVVGPPMGPDMEKLATLHADYVISPETLMNDLQPKFAQIGTRSIFVDLTSVEGLYDSMDYLGAKFGHVAQASAEHAQYEDFIATYRKSVEGRPHPRVLVLMGLPGSYLVATPKSYVGSLVEQAGGQNVYADEPDAFVNVNTEDMLARDPDIILRAAHALPDQVRDMFAKEFTTNDIWKHFRAVQQGKVYDLSYKRFGMSATFNYPDALADLKPLLYGSDDNTEE